MDSQILTRIEANEGEVTSRILRDILAESAADLAHEKLLFREYKAEDLSILRRAALETTAANNRLPNPFRTNIVDQVVGYMYGEPISYGLERTAEDEQNLEPTAEELWFQKWRRVNQIDDLDSQTGKMTSICGYGARLLYVDKDLEPQVMDIPPWEAIFIEDRSLDEVQYALRTYPVIVEENGKMLERTRVEWYDDRYVTFYVETRGGDYVLDPTEPRNPMPHQFQAIPLIRFKNNNERKGDFEGVRPLIDAYDRLISDAQNVLEDFRAAFMVFEGDSPPDPADINAMKQYRTISGPGRVYYLTKEINDAFLEKQKDTLQRNIYKFSQTVDMDDDAFHSAESGEARKWRLQSLENKAITKERKFTQALQEMFRVLCTYRRVPINDWTRITFDFRRNLPIDLQYLGEVAGKFKGIISDETLLAQFPFIEDPRDEIRRMLDEREQMPSVADIEDEEDEE